MGFKTAPKSSHHLKTVCQFSIAAVYQFTTAADNSAAEQRANERKLYWATVFRSIGDVVHLIQDMAQPQHTRNDAHAGSGCVPLVGVCAAGHDSFYEKYLKARTLQTGQFTLENGSNDRAVNTRAPQLVYEGYPTPSFATYRDFFATNEPNAQGRGLANYSNRGFYSFGTNIGSSAGLDFPLPSPFGIGLGAVTLTGSALKNMTGGAMLGSQMRFLTGTVNDTATVGADTNVKLASEGVLDQFLEARTLLPRRTLNYYNYDDQARLLIPRAVAYSAGLIDYFFRGQLKILAPDEGVFGIIDHGSSADNCKDSCGFKKVKLKLANITDYTPQQGMTGGTVVAVAKFRKNTCYTTDLNGEYDSTQDSRTRAEYALQCRSAEESIVVSQALTNKTIPRCDPAITNDCEQKALPLTFVFDNAIPINATDLYLQVVYRGALGAEADAVVVETLDIAEPTYYLINSGEFKDEYDSNGNATLKLTDMKSSEGNRRMKAHIPLFGYLYSGVGANNQPCTDVANPADPMSGYPTPTVMKAVTIIFPD